MTQYETTVASDYIDENVPYKGTTDDITFQPTSKQVEDVYDLDEEEDEYTTQENVSVGDNKLIGKDLIDTVVQMRKDLYNDRDIMSACGYSYRAKSGQIKTQGAKFNKALTEAYLAQDGASLADRKLRKDQYSTVTKAGSLAIKKEIVLSHFEPGDRFSIKIQTPKKEGAGRRIVLEELVDVVPLSTSPSPTSTPPSELKEIEGSVESQPQPQPQPSPPASDQDQVTEEISLEELSL